MLLSGLAIGWLAQAVLVLCRGLFTPRNDVTESKSKHYVFAAAFEPEAGGYPLAGAFEEVNVFPFFIVCVPIPLPCLFAASSRYLAQFFLCIYFVSLYPSVFSMFLSRGRECSPAVGHEATTFTARLAELLWPKQSVGIVVFRV